MKRSNILLFLLIVLVVGCTKEYGSCESDKDIKGVWVLKGTAGIGPGGTLVFFKKNNTNTVSFDCSGSPGPGWPMKAETAYKFENNKLSCIDYENPVNGYYQTTSFKWGVQGKEFSIKLRHILTYMSADYTVNYIKQ